MMDERKKLASQPRQDSQRPFRDAYLVVSGTMLLCCELLLLAVLFWKQPSLAQTQVPVLLLVSRAVLMPLFLSEILSQNARFFEYQAFAISPRIVRCLRKWIVYFRVSNTHREQAKEQFCQHLFFNSHPFVHIKEGRSGGGRVCIKRLNISTLFSKP